MHLIRSKTNAPFRRGGVTFQPDTWLVVKATDEQLAEANLECYDLADATIEEGQFKHRLVVGLPVASEPKSKKKADAE
jgi:hypothetical protein